MAPLPVSQTGMNLVPKILLILGAVMLLLVSGCIPLQETASSQRTQQQPIPAQQPSSPLESPAAPSPTVLSDSGSDSTAGQPTTMPQEPPAPTMPTTTPSLPDPVPTSQEQVTCEDSDAGFDPAIQGTATRTYQGEATSFEDKCNNAILLEHYCEDNIVKTREVVCDNGCTAGACLSPKPVTSSSPVSQEEYDPSKEFYNCYNGYRDTQETDVDCGGPDCFGCGYGRRCNVNGDCAEPLVCNIRMKKCSDFKH
ncbi:hypothetical protein HYS47_04630 [Candidatus Woesearchaeota archaeon]|nr:hypothetical protein [Candidatus Woesearchaeota archaeon]